MSQQHLDDGDPTIPGSGESLSTAFPKIEGNFDELYQHAANQSNPHGVTAAQVGLGNVDNTHDLDKPVSHATQSALDGKLNAASNLSDISDKAAARTNLGIGSFDGSFGKLSGSIQQGQIQQHTVTNPMLAQVGAGLLKGNPTGALADTQDAALTTFLDTISSAQGAILVRGQTAWSGLGGGTPGQMLTWGASGPSWATFSVGTEAGPATALDSAIPLFDKDGLHLKDSGVRIGTAANNALQLDASGNIPIGVRRTSGVALWLSMIS